MGVLAGVTIHACACLGDAQTETEESKRQMSRSPQSLLVSVEHSVSGARACESLCQHQYL